MLYQLMNKDKVVATYEEEKRLDDYRYTEIERLDGYVPYGFVDINDWIDGRQIAKHRTSIERAHARTGPYHASRLYLHGALPCAHRYLLDEARR